MDVHGGAKSSYCYYPVTVLVVEAVFLDPALAMKTALVSSLNNGTAVEATLVSVPPAALETTFIHPINCLYTV